MQNAPPVLPSRGSASIHRSSTARSTSPPSVGLNSLNASRTIRRPSSHDRSAAADRQRRDEVPPRQAAARVVAVEARLDAHPAAEVGERRDDADCIASNVGRLTLLANSDASSGDAQFRRRLIVFASPLIAFIADATGSSIVGQASSSASYAARRTAGSAWLASPRTAGIGSETMSVGQLDIGGELRGHVALQPTPRRGAGGRKLRVEVLLGLAHLVRRPLGQPGSGPACSRAC